MGCDIHSHVEVLHDGVWSVVYGAFQDNEYSNKDEPFENRNYGLFGFLANVRNYSFVPVIVQPRGLPEDVDLYIKEDRERWGNDGHSTSWVTLDELLAYDYDQVFWDKRVTRDGDGSATADEGEGEHLTIREFLGERYFGILETMKKIGKPENVRVVYWFDN